MPSRMAQRPSYSSPVSSATLADVGRSRGRRARLAGAGASSPRLSFATSRRSPALAVTRTRYSEHRGRALSELTLTVGADPRCENQWGAPATTRSMMMDSTWRDPAPIGCRDADELAATPTGVPAAAPCSRSGTVNQRRAARSSHRLRAGTSSVSGTESKKDSSSSGSTSSGEPPAACSPTWVERRRQRVTVRR